MNHSIIQIINQPINKLDSILVNQATYQSFNQTGNISIILLDYFSCLLVYFPCLLDQMIVSLVSWMSD